LAIKGFLKRIWKWLVLLLLLWFLIGMVFENFFEVLPEPVRRAKSIDVVMDKQMIGVEESPSTFTLRLPPLVMDQELRAKDSIFIKLPIEPVNLARIRQNSEDTNTSDTIAIRLASPIEVPIRSSVRADSYQAFSDVLVPLAMGGDADAEPIYARVSGTLKMTRVVPGPQDQADQTEQEAITEYNEMLRRPIELELGDTLVRATANARTVPVNFTLRLSDLFESEVDKNNIRTVIGDRPVRLNYTVRVGPAPTAPPPPKVELPAVQGIEVQYSDGSKRFIPNTTSTGTETIHIVAAGETLFSIAKKYNLRDASGNTSTQALMELNGLTNTALSVGQRLRIPEQ
jgi:hypothetical protein